MKSYTYVCKEPGRILHNPNAMRGGLPGIGEGIEHRGKGQCTEEEICVDHRDMAWCVAIENYVDIARHKGLITGKYDMSGKAMSAIFSQKDGKTPMDASAINIEAGNSGPGGLGLPRQHRSCRNCHELSSENFAPKTNSLGVEATMKTAAVAGVLWLALLAPPTTG